jgi:hypothetical protein
MVSGAFETLYLLGTGISVFTELVELGESDATIRLSYTNISFYLLLVVLHSMKRLELASVNRPWNFTGFPCLDKDI